MHNALATSTNWAIPQRRQGRGFTLMELVVVVAMAATLAVVAAPSYVEHVRQARRAEALAAIAQTSLAMEQWRSTHATYTANVGHAAGLALTPEPNIASYLTQAGHHRIAVTVHASSAATRYVVTATPHAPHQDPACSTLTLVVDQGVAVKQALPLANARRCWGL